MNEIYQKIARASNAKEIAIYEESELVTGQRFPGATPQVKRTGYRKVFLFGAIAAGSALNIAHNITGITEITKLYGSCVTNVVDYRPIPYVDVTAVTNQISILLSGLNIIVSNGATAPNVTLGMVICEYLKN